MAAQAVASAARESRPGCVSATVAAGARVCTDEAAAYRGLEREPAAVQHSARESGRGPVPPHGVESFRSLLKRGCCGTYRKMSPLHRYLKECEGCPNVREFDTLQQLGAVVAGLAGKCLDSRTLLAGNGLASGARG